MVFGSQFHSMARKKVFNSLDGLIKSDKVDMEGWAVDQRKFSSFPRGGVIYGLHHHAPVAGVIYYNKEHLKEAGLGTTIDHNWTVSQYMEIASKLNKPPDRFASNGLADSFTFVTFVESLGGKLFADESESKVLFDSPEVQEAIRLQIKSVDKAEPGEMKASLQKTLDAMLKGVLPPADDEDELGR